MLAVFFCLGRQCYSLAACRPSHTPIRLCFKLPCWCWSNAAVCVSATAKQPCCAVPSLSWQAMPYELRALEAALLVLVKILQHEVAALESTTLPGEAPRHAV